MTFLIPPMMRASVAYEVLVQARPVVKRAILEVSTTVVTRPS